MTTPAKIESWHLTAAIQIYYDLNAAVEWVGTGRDEIKIKIAEIIAAHAPKQAEWEAKEKALRELAENYLHCTWEPYVNPGEGILAILNDGQHEPSA